MSPADHSLAELLLIRLEVITGGMHHRAAKGISSAAALTEPKLQGFSSVYDSRTPRHLRFLPFYLLLVFFFFSDMGGCCECVCVCAPSPDMQGKEESVASAAFDSASNNRRT